ncbi:type III secretion system translocon subunit SctE [Biostraticola tofi]|uniref:Type III secretion system translocon protein (YopB/IpaB/SipB family) n=1 Tax=Biostraticola tofi TaxID=466109 RepID=A0A4R3YYT3_9GAMM|nr:type III secretion system translocon subunit SctE [Biostraticola tofi]TCV96674.1 type III secretion system translocon protein (YopB/IpaB/SipB family) [Biostraticola tofi]
MNQLSLGNNYSAGDKTLNLQQDNSATERSAAGSDQQVQNKRMLLRPFSPSLFEEAQRAARELLANQSPRSLHTAASATHQHQPMLRPPSDSGASQDYNASFVKVMSDLMVLLGSISLADLAGRLKIFQSAANAKKQHNEARAAEYDKAVKANETALKNAQADMDAANADKGDLAQRQQSVKDCEAALQKLKPGDPAYPQAEKKLQQAQKREALAVGKYRQAQQKADASYQVARDAFSKLDQLDKQIRADDKSLPAAEREPIKQAIESSAKMLFIVSTFIELLGKNSEKKLEADMAFFQSLRDGKQVEMRKLADKAEESERKAATLNATMGCVGKILGGLVTAISLVGAIFTGGASLALAAVGMTLMVSDEICKEVTGTSFMEEAMKPLMEQVIQPLIDAISQMVTGALKSLGVDDLTAQLVGGIVGAIVAAVALIAAMVIGKGAANKFASMAVSKVIMQAVKDILPQVMKNVANRSGTLFSVSVKRLLEKLSVKGDQISLKSYANKLDYVQTGVQLTSEGTKAGGQIAEAVYKNKTSDIMSYMIQSSANVVRAMESVIKTYSSDQNSWRDMQKTNSDAMTNMAQSTRFMLSKNFA